jgi:ABC-type phosphate/phosphonate transport system substrate-binding protein
MIANARMYSVSAAAAESWRQLFLSVALRAGVALEVVEHMPPAPIAQLWERPDKAAVFMCGLPYSRSAPRPQLLAAPVPSAAVFGGLPEYWSEFVVRADSPLQTLDDSFGGRIAFTTAESQSGFAAPLHYLAGLEPARGSRQPLFDEVIAPQLTPLGALQAVADGLADIAPIDSYALSLMHHFQPTLVARVRSVARSAPRPIPPLVASVGAPAVLGDAFLSAHENPQLQGRLAQLLLQRFVRPEADAYDGLRAEFESALQYWRERPLARSVHAGFAPWLGAARGSLPRGSLQ